MGVQDVTAFIIAGGKSSRMGGTDKAFLTLSGKTLVEHVIHTAKKVANDVFIVGPREKFSAYGRVVEDVYPDCGPLGGIQAALNRTRTELSMIFAVDMPFVDPVFVSYLIDQARNSSALVTVPRVSAGLQPLCAAYRQSFLPIAEEALKEGRYKIDALFADRSLVVDFESNELKTRGFDPAMFDNINSPQDYESAAKRPLPLAQAKASSKKHS